MLDITGCDLIKAVQAAYDLSSPQGLGFLHFTPVPLTDDEAKQIIERGGGSGVYMDYVKGRGCKFTIHISRDGKLTMDDERWFDHGPGQLAELIKRIKATMPAATANA